MEYEDRTLPPLAKPPGKRATRAEGIARLERAERLLRREGWSTVDATRILARECSLTHRAAEKYTSAVRARYARAAEAEPLISREEWIALVLADHAACVTAADPDYRGAQKLLETVARAQGWYAPRKLEVSGQVDHVHTAGTLTDAMQLSPGEREALRQYHEAQRARLEAGAVEAVVVPDAPDCSDEG
jgi:hypothetical protein